MQYRTTSQIKHDGKTYSAAEMIELTDSEAARLLQVGAIEVHQKPFMAQIVMPSDLAYSKPQ